MRGAGCPRRLLCCVRQVGRRSPGWGAIRALLPLETWAFFSVATPGSLDICRRRARLCLFPEEDFHWCAFERGLGAGGRSRASLSGAFLAECGFPDWPAWNAGDAILNDYMAECSHVFVARSAAHSVAVASRLSDPLPLADCSPTSSAARCAATSAILPSDVLVGQRAIARLRAGCVRAGHAHGR